LLRPNPTDESVGYCHSSASPTFEAKPLGGKRHPGAKLFYEKLGFTAFAGDQSQNWLIMKNGDRNVGLFQGMFDKNILTFNPGWTSDAQPHFDLELVFPVKKMKGA